MSLEGLTGFREELEQELRGNILAWWMKHMPDPKSDGFHGHVDHQNQVREGAPRGAILNARILWTFSAAYRQYGHKPYLEFAERAFEYILKNFLDRELGGVYWELYADGSVKSDRKQIYAIAFCIYALAEYYAASGEKTALETSIGLFRDIEEHALDRVLKGYTEALSRTWEPLEDLRLSAKDENESKTMNTHLHILEAYGRLYLEWKDPSLEAALEKLVRLFLDKFVDRETKHLHLFFDEKWTRKSTLISFGHDIECSWLLHEASEILGKKELLELTGPLAVEMARASFEGLDADGGLFYEYFPDTGELDRDKHWWPQAEAMVGYFHAWQQSGEQVFLEKSLGSWEFIKAFLVDSQLGEWYWSVDQQGRPQKEKEKGGFWKCPYHNGRACLELIRRIDEIVEILT